MNKGTTRRTILGGTCAAFSAALLAACGASATPTSTQMLKPATLRFTPANGPGADVRRFEPLLPQYMEERPNIKIEMEVIPEGGWEKINTLLTADSAADVLRINDDSVYQWGTGGKLTQLDPLINKSLKKEDFFAPTWQAMAVDGKLYSMQPHFGVNLFVYNKTLFQKAGITAPTEWKTAWPWDTFVTNMRKLQALGGPAGSGSEVYGAHIGGGYMIPLIWGNGVKQYNTDETKCTFNSPEGLAILSEMEALIHTHKLVVTSGNTTLFQNTRLGMNFGDPGFGTTMPADVQWDLMPLPKSKKDAYQEGFVRTFAIPKSTKEVDASWDFMRWLMQTKAQIHLGREGYGVPALKSAGDPTFKESNLKDKNWKLIPEGMNHDVPLAYNPIAQTFKSHYNSKAGDFYSAKQNAKQWLDQGCLDTDAKIRELGWKKKG